MDTRHWGLGHAREWGVCNEKKCTHSIINKKKYYLKKKNYNSNVPYC